MRMNVNLKGLPMIRMIRAVMVWCLSVMSWDLKTIAAELRTYLLFYGVLLACIGPESVVDKELFDSPHVERHG